MSLGKILHVTRHARARMWERAITVPMVMTVLLYGVRRPAGTRPGKEPRQTSTAVVGGTELLVVFTENDRRILVLTVQWVKGRT